MSRIHKQSSRSWLIIIVAFMIIDFALLLFYFVHGKNIALFNPQGAIAQEQHNLMMFTIKLVLIFAIPTVSFLFFTAWRYRESNLKVKRNPKARPNLLLVLIMWFVPSAFIVVLAVVMWPATHKLSPQNTIGSQNKTMTIEVISMRWKWLFIYPEQNIATVNFVQIPVGTPVQFEMTADEAPMSSFWIPNLGGQLYTMTSHSNRLNLIADKPGDYPGSTPEINGEGFSGMRFTARASSLADFDAWVAQVKQARTTLDKSAYNTLLKPSENTPTTMYASYQEDFYDTVLAKYAELNGGHHH